jgi:plasmid maintenance system antidote protein VapI
MHNPTHPGLIIRDDVLLGLQLNLNNAFEALLISCGNIWE